MPAQICASNVFGVELVERVLGVAGSESGLQFEQIQFIDDLFTWKDPRYSVLEKTASRVLQMAPPETLTISP